MENLGNARVTAGEADHICPNLPLFPGCELWPSSLLDSISKVMSRRFQREKSAPFPSRKVQLCCKEQRVERKLGWENRNFTWLLWKQPEFLQCGFSWRWEGGHKLFQKTVARGSFTSWSFILFPVIAVGFCSLFHCLLGYFTIFFFFPRVKMWFILQHHRLVLCGVWVYFSLKTHPNSTRWQPGPSQCPSLWNRILLQPDSLGSHQLRCSIQQMNYLAFPVPPSAFHSNELHPILQPGHHIFLSPCCLAGLDSII